MKSDKLLYKALSVFAAVTILFCSLLTAANAITTKNGSITIHVADAEKNTPISDASFRLYFFAKAIENSNGIGYKYVNPYDGCNMEMGDLQDSYLPIHLANFALTHSLPYSEKASDINGEIIFNNLTPGVYLILLSTDMPDYFMPAPFVINIPLYDNENKDWIYDINASPKMQIFSSTSSSEVTYLSVRKIWDTTEPHPDSVTVSLLRDYKEYAFVILDESNNWYFRWDNLPKNHSWSVVESSVPDGYSVSYEASSNTVTITNKKTVSQDTDETETTEPTTEIDREPTTERDELIDTGQLNWPVPVLSITGLISFSIGWAMLNITKKKES